MKVFLADRLVTIEKMQDSTHVKMDGRAYHVGEFRNKEFGNDLYQWLGGNMTEEQIESKQYD